MDHVECCFVFFFSCLFNICFHFLFLPRHGRGGGEASAVFSHAAQRLRMHRILPHSRGLYVVLCHSWFAVVSVSFRRLLGTQTSLPMMLY